jgi:two-component system, OmpR family, heavy metal sensor histidine kinase CusS
MSTWLTACYAGSILLLLTLASGVLYWGLVHSMRQQDDDFLAHKMQVLTALLEQRPSNLAGINQEVFEEAELSSTSPSPFFLRILDRDERLVAETPNMATVLPPGAFLDGACVAGARSTLSVSGGPVHFLCAATSVPRDSRLPQWHIQAAMNVSSQANLLARYRRDIALVLAGGLLVAIVTGAWITRRGLEPIAEITRAAERIDAQLLEERIDPGPWPRELAALASAFDRMLARLQESFERLSQFSADLAHELRTPINNLLGEAQVALSRPRGSPEYVRVLQSALEEYGRLGRMIDSMLFLAQADRNRAAVDFAPLDAGAELRAVADFYQAVADEEGKTLDCEGDVRLHADPLLVRRAISNLLSNALKYSPCGAHVSLRAAASSDGRPTLSVTDCGIGIASEHLSKLGDRFYRIDPSRTGSPGGAGLGLAIVKSIMALHGGALLIESEPGRGTTATLLFPAPAASPRERKLA